MTPHGAVPPPPPLSWRDRVLSWRDRLLADPRFQRFAVAFPPTRRVADREARALFDIVAGFVYSQVLAALVELRLLPILAEGPATVAELAARTGLAPEAAERLLEAAVSLKLAGRRSAGRYGLGARGAAFLGNPGIAEMVAHHTLLYRDLADPVGLLRGRRGATGLGGFWPYAAGEREGLDRADVEGYSRLMAASQGFVAEDLLDACPELGKVRRLMDVGGGDGTFLTRAAARHPALEVVLFDLPAVAGLARERFAAAGLGARATAVGGSFRDASLPQGADAVSLVRVVHDHDDPVVLDLLTKIHAALPPGGLVLIGEPMGGVPGAERVGDAYFGFYLLAMGSGRARTPTELSGLLDRAGFAQIRQIRTARPLLTGLITATRPSG